MNVLDFMVGLAAFLDHSAGVDFLSFFLFFLFVSLFMMIVYPETGRLDNEVCYVFDGLVGYRNSSMVVAVP